MNTKVSNFIIDNESLFFNALEAKKASQYSVVWQF